MMADPDEAATSELGGLSAVLLPALPRRKSMGAHQSAAMLSDVWLTPPEILAALGPFDLDPCAPVNRPWDMAARHYTKADNGLHLPWYLYKKPSGEVCECRCHYSSAQSAASSSRSVSSGNGVSHEASGAIAAGAGSARGLRNDPASECGAERSQTIGLSGPDLSKKTGPESLMGTADASGAKSSSGNASRSSAGEMADTGAVGAKNVVGKSQGSAKPSDEPTLFPQIDCGKRSSGTQSQSGAASGSGALPKSTTTSAASVGTPARTTGTGSAGTLACSGGAGSAPTATRAGASRRTISSHLAPPTVPALSPGTSFRHVGDVMEARVDGTLLSGSPISSGSTECCATCNQSGCRLLPARTWLNPPYGREAVRWLRRLSAHGRGTALIFARTETAMFFETVWRSATARGLLFLEGRLHFHRPDGTRANANAGAPSVLVAYGDDDAERLRSSGLAGRFLPLGGEHGA